MLKNFIKNEDGVETIEALAFLAVSAMFIGIIVRVAMKTKSTAVKTGNYIDKMLTVK